MTSPSFNFTIQDIIAVLSEYPPDMPMLVSGYETGYENCRLPKIVTVEWHPENNYWDGEFQDTAQPDGIKVVVLERVMRDVR